MHIPIPLSLIAWPPPLLQHSFRSWEANEGESMQVIKQIAVVKDAPIPTNLRVITLMRDPLSKAFSIFFKRNFPGVHRKGEIDNFSHRSDFNLWLGPADMSRATSGVLNNRTAIMGALR